jgi:ATP-binding cassette subfamily E protein 1
LDVKQRLKAALVIRSIVGADEAGLQRYCIVVEHDLAVLDYLSGRFE